MHKKYAKSIEAVAVTASTGLHILHCTFVPSLTIVTQILQCVRFTCVDSSYGFRFAGIAACNIGGITIHSFAGIGLGIESAEDLATKVRKNKKSSSRWLRTKVLIIDEGLLSQSRICLFRTHFDDVIYSLVSMVDGELFDKLARIGSIMRKRTDPFGGIQVSYIFPYVHPFVIYADIC